MNAFYVRNSRRTGNLPHDPDLLADRIDQRETNLREKDGQRNPRETASAPHVQHPRTGVERTHLRDGQPVQHMPQVKLVDVLTRNDVDPVVPFAVQRPESGEPFPLYGRKFRKIFQNEFHVLFVMNSARCPIRRQVGRANRSVGQAAFRKKGERSIP